METPAPDLNTAGPSSQFTTNVGSAVAAAPGSTATYLNVNPPRPLHEENAAASTAHQTWYGGYRSLNKDTFVVRTHLVRAIARHLDNNPHQASPTQQASLTVLHGLGGIGKTQLASYYFHHNEKAYRHQLWLDARDVLTLQQGLVDYGKAIQLLPEQLPQGLDLATAAKRVKAHLETHPGWLMVLDNACAAPAAGSDAPACDPKALNPYFPVKGGHLLITSRQATFTHPIPVGKMTMTESMLLIIKILSPTTPLEGWEISIAEAAAEAATLSDEAESISPKNEAILAPRLKQWLIAHEVSEATLATYEQLITTLGQLPLALAQAASYIRYDDTCTVSGYLTRYTMIRAELFAKQDLPSLDEHEPVAITWRMEQAWLQATAPMALALLIDCAYLHDSLIPTPWLLAWHAHHGDAGLANLETLNAEQARELRLHRLSGVLNSLKRYALIETQTDGIQMHCVLQAVLQDQEQAKPTLQQQRRASVGQCLISAYPEAKPKADDFVLARTLQPHMVHIVEQLNQTTTNSVTAITILQAALSHGVADAYYAVGQYQGAKTWWTQALKFNEAHYGADHVAVAKPLNNLANTEGFLGNITTHKTLLLRALNIKKAHYGPGHFDVAMTLNDLANVEGELGDNAKKKALLLCALPIFETHYGRDHPNVANMLNNLANAEGKLGNNTEKRALLLRALAVEEACYGPDHVEVAETLHNLANAEGGLGDNTKKKALLLRALSVFEAHYGLDHPKVAMTRYNLGRAECALGATQAGFNHIQWAYDIYANTPGYGPDHPLIQTMLKQKTALASMLISGAPTPTVADAPSSLEQALNQAFAHHEQAIQAQARGEDINTVQCYYTAAMQVLRPFPLAQHAVIAEQLLVWQREQAELYQAAHQIEEAIKRFNKVIRLARDVLKLPPTHAYRVEAEAGLNALVSNVAGPASSLAETIPPTVCTTSSAESEEEIEHHVLRPGL